MSSSILPPLSPEQPQPQPRQRLTVTEFHRLIDEGVLGENDRVELLEGLMVPKMTHNPLHDGVIQIVSKRLERHLPPQWSTRIQSAITTADSEPEPDIAIVRGDERTYLTLHPRPQDVAVLIEVAESSLNQDRQDKGRLYARARIAVYWIVNLIDFQIEVLSDPTGSDDAPEYRTRQVFRGDDVVPVVIDGREIVGIPAKDLLP
ncbi:MAG TPA: Uma2 family endonuclease [Planctomycetaceae bacterium]|jgi:Uma2 family endonuclease